MFTPWVWVPALLISLFLCIKAWMSDDYKRGAQYFYKAFFFMVLIITMMLMNGILDSKIGFLIVGVVWGVLLRQAFIFDNKWR